MSLKLDQVYTNEDMICGHLAEARFDLEGFVYQTHIRAFPRNVHILNLFKMRPIILYRNLLDSVVAMRDHVNGFWPKDKQNMFNGIHFPPDWDDLNEQEQYAWIARNAIGWHLSFYVGWHLAEIPTYFSSYTEFFKDQVSGIRGMLGHIGVPIGLPDKQILEICETTENRRNPRGMVAGRGRKMIDQKTIDIVYEQAELWSPKWSPTLVQKLLEEE